MTRDHRGGEPVTLDESAIDADLRRFAAGIDLARPDATAAVWQAFIEYASRPLAFGTTFDDHPDNDQLSFETYPRPDEVIVTLRRDIGVVHVVEGYRGTIAALWGLKAATGEHWPADASRCFAGHGIASDGLDAFRRQVEQSDVFSALLSSRIAELTVMAYYV